MRGVRRQIHNELELGAESAASRSRSPNSPASVSSFISARGNKLLQAMQDWPKDDWFFKWNQRRQSQLINQCCFSYRESSKLESEMGRAGALPPLPVMSCLNGACSLFRLPHTMEKSEAIHQLLSDPQNYSQV